METHPDLEHVRKEVEDRQRSILWEDQFRNNRFVTDFLWHGNPNAKFVQRAGLGIFGLFFLLCGLTVFINNFERNVDDRSFLSILFSMTMLLISIRLFRNALLRSKHRDERGSDNEKNLSKL